MKIRGAVQKQRINFYCDCTRVAAATTIVGEEAVDLGLRESHQSVSRGQCMQTQM